ncbi:MAG: hypothetical protein NE328_14810 [Lentisphaeraceae bacterium]|nr:hypothetical protein [Lentisphaeraceae bacterium]
MIKYLGLVLLLTFNLIAEDDKPSVNDIKAALTPENLDFSSLESEMEKYIKSFPEEKQSIESRRLGIVKNFKKMVQKVVNRSPYQGKIFLKQSVVMGKIMEAKDDGLTIIDSKNETSSIKWEELNLRQYSDIFIAEAVSKGKELTANKRPADADKMFKKAGNYYFALAVFYDWYGNEAASVLFRNKALILNPGLKEEIANLWPTK